MQAYEGNEPYVFASYSHKDANIVLKIITLLKQKMCRIWYDEGLTPGESWNDNIAEHLLKCSQFILFISPDSVTSKYVMSEINFALTKNKNVLPVIIRKTELPVGLEMMIGTIQMLDVSDGNDIQDSVDKIASVLQKEVFSLKAMPFVQDSGYSFYVYTQDVERKETNIKPALQVICKDQQGNELEIFNMHRLGAYEVWFRISSVDAVTDYFYSGKITGLYKVNILCGYNLEYPLYGPDADVLLVLILRIPRHGVPTMKLVDYQYVNLVGSCPDDENLDAIGEAGWSKQIKDYLEQKLYK